MDNTGFDISLFSKVVMKILAKSYELIYNQYRKINSLRKGRLDAD